MEDWRFDRSQVDAISVVQQSMKGLAYLHSAGIGRYTALNVNLEFLPWCNYCITGNIVE